MAKQNVSTIERHVEKPVLGLAALVLLAMAYLYGLRTPYTVDLDGEAVGAAEFYRRVAQAADNVVQRMKQASAENLEPPRLPVTARTARVPTDMPVTFAALQPGVPEIERVRLAGKLRLVMPPAPTPPLVTTGRAYTRLPPEPDTGASLENIGSGATVPDTVLNRDHSWVTVFSSFDRAKVRDEYVQAAYGPEAQAVLVAEVQLQRQRLLPSGAWQEEPEPVRTFARQLVDPRSRTVPVTPDPEDPTQFLVTEDYQKVIDEIRQALSSSTSQSLVVRPAIQKYLTQPLDWTAPESLPPFGLDPMDFGVIMPDLQAEAAGRTRKPAEPGARPARAGRQQAADDLRAADEAFRRQDYLEVNRLLEAVLANADATATDRDRAEKMLEELRGRIDQAQRLAAEQRTATLQELLGPEKDMIWAIDLTVAPGQTYRYRMRLMMFNNYAGKVARLETPQDAGQVLLAGEWSAWSDPITVRPTQYLWFTGVGASPDIAKVELRQWSQGTWRQGAGDVQVGRPVTVKPRSGADLTYDGVVLAIDPARPYRERTEAAAGANVKYADPRMSPALILMKSDGQTEERLALADAAERRAVIAAIRDEEKRRETLQPRQPKGSLGGSGGYVRPMGPRPPRLE